MSTILRFPEVEQHPTEIRSKSNHAFMTDVLGAHSERRATFGRMTHLKGADSLGTTSLLVQATYQAYNAHAGLCLRPEVMWYAVVSEIAEHIRQNYGEYRGLLGMERNLTAPLGIMDFKPDALYGRIREELLGIVGNNKLVELLAPNLSTVDTDERLALLAALMQAAGPRQTPTAVSACGIPHIQIEGTGDDWALLKSNIGPLSYMFRPLSDYLEAVRDVLHRIECTVKGQEINLGNFWESIYQYRSEVAGNGVNGWITTLFAHQRVTSGTPELRSNFTWWNKKWTGMELGQFASHITAVPVKSATAEDAPTFHMNAGITGIHLGRTDDGLPLLTPRLGWGMVHMQSHK